MSEKSFIHLRVHSAYSLAEGAIHPKTLVKLCKKNRMPAVAVTDSGNLFGALEFALEAANNGVQPIIGCQILLGIEGHELGLLAQNEEGYRNLCRLVSESYLKVEPPERPHVTWGQLEECADGIICLSGGAAGPVAQYILHNQNKEAEQALKRLKKIYAGRLYVELQRHGLQEEDRAEELLIELAYKHDVPLVATNECYFAEQSMHEAHDALLCIAAGRYVTESDRRTETPEHYFKNAQEMIDLFSDIPEAVDNTRVIAQRCSFLLESINPILPAFATEGGRSEEEELRAQAEEGLEWRLEHFVAAEADRKIYKDRLEYELGVIISMGFAGYFLIVSDFIKWAKDNRIPVGPGRGSGAGSLVAWSLKITDIDPIRFGILFERFLNPERVSMPDFDIDFCQERRDEVIRYVQERYGHDKVAQIITFGKLQARAVVRDVGRVLQMPYGQVDRIAKMIPANPANPVTLAEALAQDADLRAEIDKEETSQKLIDIALKLEGLYRHASTHAAGVVIGDRPLQELCPLYRDPRSTIPATQFNMKYVEQAGLIKFDFLGLKTMTVIQKTVDLLAQNGTEIDILKVPLEDERTFAMLAEGQTVGVFQFESAGMRDMLKKMKADRFEDMIALVALYRPGPMDDIPRYIAAKLEQEDPEYLHPKIKPILEETFGVITYQEQVMEIARVLSGYTLGAADLLRRAMGKKIKAEMDKQEKVFIEGAVANGIKEPTARLIFEKMAKFAGYGFNKCHSGPYALIAYWTAWLKANYPVEFMAASMTLDLHNTDKLAVFKQELDRMGVELLPPDVNKSGAVFRVEDGAIRYALGALKGVGAGAMESLSAERDANGPFKGIADFAGRVPPGSLNKRQLEQMACAGAFDSLNPNRAQVFESAETILRHAQVIAEERESGQTSLFGGEGGAPAPLPELRESETWDGLEQLRREFDSVGFYLSAHPLDSRAGQMERMGIVPVAAVEERLGYSNSALLEMAGVLIKKQIKVSPKSGNKYAFLQLSDSTGVYEAVLFSDLLARVRDNLEEGQTFLVKVTVEQREDQIRYTVQDIRPLEDTLAKKVQEAHIYLEGTGAAAKVREVLTAEGQGRVRVIFRVPMGEEETAEIELAERWNFSPETQSAMSRAEGVGEIRVF